MLMMGISSKLHIAIIQNGYVNTSLAKNIRHKAKPVPMMSEMRLSALRNTATIEFVLRITDTPANINETTTPIAVSMVMLLTINSATINLINTADQLTVVAS